jgi:hypothetical protein
MLLVAPLLKDPRWTASEKALVLLAFEPLTSTGEPKDDSVFSAALLPPDAGSGIKAETLQSLISNRGRKEDIIARRLELQRLVCKSTDVSLDPLACPNILNVPLRFRMVSRPSPKFYGTCCEYWWGTATHRSM